MSGGRGENGFIDGENKPPLSSFSLSSNDKQIKTGRGARGLCSCTWTWRVGFSSC